MTGGYNIIFAEKGQDADDDVKQFLSYGLAIHNLESNDLYDSNKNFIDKKMGEDSSLAIITNGRGVSTISFFQRSHI